MLPAPALPERLAAHPGAEAGHEPGQVVGVPRLGSLGRGGGPLEG